MISQIQRPRYSSTVRAPSYPFSIKDLSISRLKELKHKSSTYSYLKSEMKDPESVAYLRNRSVFILERNEELKNYLVASLIAMNSAEPFLSGNNLSSFISQIRKAHVDDFFDGAKSIPMKFGVKNKFSSSTFLGVTFHELMHNILKISHQILLGGLQNNSLHEFLCDLKVLHMYSQIAGQDRDTFNEWFEEYIKQLGFSNAHSYIYNKSYGIGDKEHKVAKAVLSDLVRPFREHIRNELDVNLDVKDFVELLYTASMELLEEYKRDGRQKNLHFETFIRDLSKKLQPLLASHDLTLDIERFSNETLQDKYRKYLSAQYGSIPHLTPKAQFDTWLNSSNHVVVPWILISRADT